jgi:hypothetical protein
VLIGAAWLLGAVGLAGLGLICFHLLERPIRGWARLASIVHGVAGAAGVALVVTAVVRAGVDRQGFGRLAVELLAATLLGGLLVAAAHGRRRRPAGLLVALHAMAGVAGIVIVAAYVSTGGG